MKPGDIVFHRVHGKGKLKRLCGNDLAEVDFRGDLQYVQILNLTTPQSRKKKQSKTEHGSHSGSRYIRNPFEKNEPVTLHRDNELTKRIQELKKQEEEKKRRQEEAQRIQEQKRQQAIKVISDKFENNFLRADAYYQRYHSSIISHDEFTQLKVNFVKHWVFNKTGITLDDEQALACSTTGQHVQIIARAGSGKTRTLINRAIFLQKHCNILPNKMLLLAFNKKATEEMQDRLAEHLGDNIPHVMTFHALAYAISHPEENLIYDDSNGSQQKSRTTQEVIDAYLRTDEGFQQIRELMLDQFSNDWEAIESGHYDMQPEEFLEYRRSLPRLSMNGEYVKSFGEKVIADFLFEHNISYKYEKNHIWNDINYKPDFTLPFSDNQGVIIEYFGLEGDQDYDEMSESKRAYWNDQPSWDFLEFSPKNFTVNGKEGFCQYLHECLEHMGIQCIKLDEHDIWLKIKDRAIDRFTKAMVGFIQRCRKLRLSPLDLSNRIAQHHPINSIEERFIHLGQFFYESYLDQIHNNNEEDFDGLMEQAIHLINNGHTHFIRRSQSSGDLTQLKYIFIDEYQDFSLLFFEIINAIKIKNDTVSLFCVGDDWQAINGFAGSDLAYFTEFDGYFNPTDTLYLSTNYRSRSSVVALGNEVMNGFGKPAKAYRKEKNLVRKIILDDYKPSDIERQRHQGDNITPVVLRLIWSIIQKNNQVVLLSRRNWLNYYVNDLNTSKPKSKTLNAFLNHIRSYFPEELGSKITASTAHQYKGLEQYAVIVLDAINKSYPLIHPDAIFLRLFGDSMERLINDERRLFYVALTRASDQLFIITSNKDKTIFLDNSSLREINYGLIGFHSENDNSLRWDQFPPPPSLESRIVIRMSSLNGYSSSPTYKIKDLLKADGFQYKYQWNQRKVWGKMLSQKKLSFSEIINNACWSSGAEGLSVLFHNENDEPLACYYYMNGRWYCDYDVNN